MADVVAAIREVAPKLDDPSCILASGGSHGGYLVTMLLGRYPEMFLAASTRNPVTSLSSMYYETDISDWCLCESGLDAADAATFHNLSPMKYVGAVKTPVLLGLGKNDQRVPAPQGRSWAREVRANSNGCVVKVMEYPNNGHSLDGVAAEADFAMHTALFFKKYAMQHLTQNDNEMEQGAKG